MKSGAAKVFEAYTQNEFFSKKSLIEDLVEEHQTPDEALRILKLD